MKPKLLILFLSVFALQSCYEEDVSAGYDYQEGDVITMVPPFNSLTDSVEYYWDDAKIATKYERPFVNNFEVTNSVGSGVHSYTIKTCYRTSDGGNGDTQMKVNVTIR